MVEDGLGLCELRLLLLMLVVLLVLVVLVSLLVELSSFVVLVLALLSLLVLVVLSWLAIVVLSLLSVVVLSWFSVVVLSLLSVVLPSLSIVIPVVPSKSFLLLSKLLLLAVLLLLAILLAILLPILLLAVLLLVVLLLLLAVLLLLWLAILLVLSLGWVLLGAVLVVLFSCIEGHRLSIVGVVLEGGQLLLLEPDQFLLLFPNIDFHVQLILSHELGVQSLELLVFLGLDGAVGDVDEDGVEILVGVFEIVVGGVGNVGQVGEVRVQLGELAYHVVPCLLVFLRQPIQVVFKPTHFNKLNDKEFYHPLTSTHPQQSLPNRKNILLAIFARIRIFQRDGCKLRTIVGLNGFNVIIQVYLQRGMEVNLIVLGEFAVGKTSILHKIKGQSFSQNPEATVAIDFFSLKFEIKGRDVKVHFWDTAGQQKFNNIAKQYYRTADGCIMVGSCEKTMGQNVADCQKFLTLCKENHSQVPHSIYFLNKKDLVDYHYMSSSDSREGIQQLKQKHKMKCEWVSAKTTTPSEFAKLLEPFIAQVYQAKEAKKGLLSEVVTETETKPSFSIVHPPENGIKETSCC